MSVMNQAATLCPRPLSRTDAAALIGLLATLEGETWVGSVDPDVIRHLSKRLAKDGLLTPHADQRTFRQALNDLNHRLRYALGEYDEPPQPTPLPE